MRKRIILVVAVLLIIVGLFLLVKVAANILKPHGRGALQITTSIKATVFLDDKSIGSTPLCLCDQNQTIDEGLHDLKILPDDKTLDPYSTRIKINAGVLTAVERTFLPGALSSSYILTLEKTNSSDPQIFISSVPDGALISVDSEQQGISPLTLPSISASEHEVEIQKEGFAKKTVRVRAVANYKLILDTILGTQGSQNEAITATPTAALSPTPTLGPVQNTVTILQTPTGFLRVRETPSIGSKEVGRVNPGETYVFTNENDLWYEIKLKDETIGWISKTYAQKVITPTPTQ